MNKINMRKKKEVADESSETESQSNSKIIPTPDRRVTLEIPDLEVARKLVNIHSSAQSRGLEFDLSFEYVKKLLEFTHCYYTGVAFSEEGPGARSFDRVDNDRGYIIGNVVACTTDINGKKNNLSLAEIMSLSKKLAHLVKS